MKVTNKCLGELKSKTTSSKSYSNTSDFSLSISAKDAALKQDPQDSWGFGEIKQGPKLDFFGEMGQTGQNNMNSFFGAQNNQKAQTQAPTGTTQKKTQEDEFDLLGLDETANKNQQNNKKELNLLDL